MTFGNPETLRSLPTMNREEIDALPFGVIKVNDAGVIELFSQFESNLSSVPIAKAEGRNFFTQVAPCMNNRLIFGRFKEGVVSGEMDATMQYTLTYKMRPTNVNLQLYRDPSTGTNWVLIQRR